MRMEDCGGLYREEFEHDSCGVGALINISGEKTHSTVDGALKIVEKLAHRAGRDAEGKTGDGVGILMQVSHDFFYAAAKECGIEPGGEGDYGVGMFFFPQDEAECAAEQKKFEDAAASEGLKAAGWRAVPVRPEILGNKARSSMPRIMQCFVLRPENAEKGLDFERRLYTARRVYERAAKGSYVCSCSSRTIVYKGMFLVDELRRFYPDLQSEDMKSAIAMVHSRFSTNTEPSWKRAHPNRFITHNGEINTIRGNEPKMAAREESMRCEAMDSILDRIYPVVDPTGSDSTKLDNTLEFLVMSGMPLPKAVMICIPEAWRNSGNTGAKQDFYHYYSTVMEAWDGPASILFSDGDIAGAALDRNGLRPSRYYMTSDGQVILSSEVGVLDIEPEKIIKKSRIRPGSMLVVDTVNHRVLENDEIKSLYASEQPYGKWVANEIVRLGDLPAAETLPERVDPEKLACLQKVSGYAWEDITETLIPMAETENAPTAAMGSDIPLAVLDTKDRPLFDYFQQMFAQVTNPPIDTIREEIVTDTYVYAGRSGNLLEEAAENCRVLEIPSPILSDAELSRIKALDMPGLKSAVIPATFKAGTDLGAALENMFAEAEKAMNGGADILILSDRSADAENVPMPSLLAVSALQQKLIRDKKCTSVSIIAETAEPRDIHHFALLLGYGAVAVCPYLAHETVRRCAELGLLKKDAEAACAAFDSAAMHGIVKIASKMGISTIQSYQSAQIFEAVGLNSDVIDKYFTGTVCRVGGRSLADIQKCAESMHRRAYDPLDTELDSPGEHRLRAGQETHLWSPSAIFMLQKAVRDGDYEEYKKYASLIDDSGAPQTLRSLMEFRFAEDPLPLDEVEPEEEIVKHFTIAAMSYGALSAEAHECMAQAMNELGAASNCGEGGEDASRFGTIRGSKIKQVASGRFGVTSEYLVSAEEIQIKMAQGAKPGEGGNLPGKKVYPWIARARHSTPGVSLISPPPHHDIYSIEDLAQLIYDLKCSNRRAVINVKLVSEAGVGTIASGVAKAGAGGILISGFDGGTGAALRSSIHHAGLPWELGLAETHRTLMRNGLRSRVKLETDGKLMTGRDLAIACMLGAESFAFGTAPMIALGCVMMRVCNLNTCPMGIATQDPRLRARFRGRVQDVKNLMLFLAKDLREHMASLGIRSVNELVGRVDLLKEKDGAAADISSILDASYVNCGIKTHFDPADAYDFGLESTADVTKLEKELLPLVKDKSAGSLDIEVSSTDRTFGTVFGSEVTRAWGENALPDGTYTVRCKGGGGQSFGSFLPKGVKLVLEGDSNDYLGKGLSGGEITVRPPEGSPFVPEENIIIGNVALYGATAGKVFIRGMAGERFAVRNSGAEAVVEGVGDHGCEYMTGGTVVIIGPTGRNVAAGMSGGTAYVLDEDGRLEDRINRTMVYVSRVSEQKDIDKICGLLREHIKETGSAKAEAVLKSLPEDAGRFVKILPKDYDLMLRTISKYEDSGMTRADAETAAFNEVMG